MFLLNNGIVRKLPCLIIFVIMLFFVINCTANAEIVNQGTCGENLTWVLDDKGKLTISGSGDMDDISISWEADPEDSECSPYLFSYPNRSPWIDMQVKEVQIEYGVTSISTAAFCGCRSIRNFIIPDSVICIGECAFASTDIEEITLPDTITSIGEGAFASCMFLKSVTIPNGITKINDFTFYDCECLIDVKFPDTLTVIGSVAFSSQEIKKIILPDSLITIEAQAFVDCISLANIWIPDSIKQIGFSAFYSNTVLSFHPGNSYAKQYAESNHLQYRIIDASSKYCGDDVQWRLLDSGELIIQGSGFINSYDEHFNEDDYVNDPYFDVPWDRKLIKKITINAGITRIGDAAFKDCINLEEVSISDSVTLIGNYAFMGCDNLREITIPGSVVKIGEYAFSHCNLMKRAVIQNGVEEIDSSAFSWCLNLESITLSDCLTSIGDSAFSGCLNLASIDIPDTVTLIGQDAFYCCTSLISICIPENVHYISYLTFYGCEKLEKIILPPHLEIIGNRAFYGCNNLRSINLPDELTTIRNLAFHNCNLSFVSIPKSVKVIEDNAFEYCFYLTDVEILGDTISFGKNLFYGSPTIYCYESTDVDCWASENGYNRVYLNNENIDAMRKVKLSEELSLSCWETFTLSPIIIPSIDQPDIIWSSSDPFVICVVDGKVIALSPGSATITAQVGNASATVAVTVSNDNIQGLLCLPASLKTVEASAFEGMSMKAVLLPDGCERIESRAFANCPHLEYIRIPSSVIYIASDAFEGSIQVYIDQQNINQY